MNLIEKCSMKIRHNNVFLKLDWLWDVIRPMYVLCLKLMYPGGLVRNINSEYKIRVLPEYRMISEVYEPDVWNHLMKQLKQDDIFVDVGAYVGLYTIAVANQGHSVHAFEPSHINFKALKTHVSINNVNSLVHLYHSAVSDKDGQVSFSSSNETESSISDSGDSLVQSVRLDSVFADKKIDILKIDVEGFEEFVLRGSSGILLNNMTSPRCIYIEVHPYAWQVLGTTSASIINLLTSFNYTVKDIYDNSIDCIYSYGEIVAYKN